MNAMTCRQTWKVEAVRDGQLAAPDSEMIASHVQVCMYCASENERLEQIGSAVRQIPVREPSPLVVRIQRRKLLEEAAQALPASGRFKSGIRTPAHPMRMVLAAAAAFVLVWAGVRQFSAKHEIVATPVPQPVNTDSTMVASEIEVRAMPDTRWSQRSEPPVQLIALEQGALWTKITHKRPHPPVVFRVPDGQIEDIGTTFAVTVQNGQTQRVVVDEGAVLLRLNGMKEQRVTAPNTWVRPSELGSAPAAEPAPVANTPAAEPSPSEVAPVEAPAQPSAAAASADADQTAKVRPRTDAKAAKKAGAEEIKLYKKATAAYRAGRNTEALALFDRFSALYPHSMRSEDVSYLRVLSLAKAGQATQAVSAGEDYLSRFPSGFRRKEMEDFVKRAKP